MIDIEYPGVSNRVKAVIFDGFISIVFMFSITYFFSSFDITSETARIIAFVGFFLLYDPIFTSFFGGTIGHKMVGIRVKREDEPERNINFFVAILRYLFKNLLGWISLLTVSSHQKHKAIHDLMTGSIVLFAERK